MTRIVVRTVKDQSLNRRNDYRLAFVDARGERMMARTGEAYVIFHAEGKVLSHVVQGVKKRFYEVR